MVADGPRQTKVSNQTQCFICGQTAPVHIIHGGAAPIFGGAIPLVTTNNQRTPAAAIICMNCLALLKHCLVTFAHAQMTLSGGVTPPPPAKTSQQEPEGPKLKLHNPEETGEIEDDMMEGPIDGNS